MVSVHIYVEGGGDKKDTIAACLEGFNAFFGKAFPDQRLLRIIPCGGRAATYKRFKLALQEPLANFSLMLVDSEGPVAKGRGPWEYLKRRKEDSWDRPKRADDTRAYLMVQCMEAWFLADRDALKLYFGNGFKPDKLPNVADVETIGKDQVFEALKSATKTTKTKGRYEKGDHSFRLLARIDPDKVIGASQHAKRLFDFLAQNLK